MNNIGIVGAGTMGAGIGHVAALSGCNVVLHDVSEDLLNRALKRIDEDLQKGIEKQKLTPQQKSDALKRIQTTTSFEKFSKCEFVVEAAIEKVDVKHQIFRHLESVCSEKTILASNTSSLSITVIAANAKHPERIAGMHFFNPPHLMKLVEVIRGNHTSEHTIEQTVQFAKQLDKTPVIAKDTPGFIVNRIARPFYGEALRILGEGITTVEEIDRIVTKEGGFKMGPFALMDLIGIDVNFAVTQSMYEQTFGEPRYKPHVIQQTMVNAGKLGKKTKQGFYKYDK